MVGYSFFCIVAIVAQAPCSALAQTTATSEARFLAGLRERQLFELADRYCKQQLAEAYLVRGRRAELTIELARTALEAALYARPPQRDERFTEAAAVLDGAKFERADDPWRLPVAVQRGVVELVQGELLREETQLLNAPEAGLTAARDRLRSAVGQLRKAREAVDEQLRIVNKLGATVKPDEPSAAELAALKRHVDYQLARAYRNQGESYPPKSPDRAAALDQAVAALEAIARSEATDGLTWQARLDEVACRRALGDLDGADRMLDLIDKETPPAEISDRTRAQRIRIRLEAQAIEEAEKFVRPEDAESTSNVDPEARLAVVEWLFAAAETAAKQGRQQVAQERQRQGLALAKLIAERYPPAWGRRAELATASSVASQPTNDAAPLLKAAESMYHQGNVERALELYDQAAARAATAADRETAFVAGFTAAAIVQQRGRYDAAAERFAKLALSSTEHPRAAEAQLAAAFNTAQLFAGAQDADAVRTLADRYAGLLTTQIACWPSAAATAQARVWLGRLRRQQRDWPAAIVVLQEVPPSDPAAVEAVRLLSSCYAEWFASLLATGRDVPLAEAERTLARFAPDLPERVPDVDSPTTRAAVMGLVRLELEFANDRFARSCELLQALLKNPALADDEKAAATAWLILAEVGVNCIDTAAELAAQSTTWPSTEAAIVVTRLDELAAAQPPQTQAKTAAIAIRLIGGLRSQRSALSSDVAAKLTAAEARALARTGRQAEAKKAWDAVLAQSPHDPAVQTAYAEFLLSQNDRESTTAALVRWRELERAARESSPEWYQARLGLIRSYLQLGEKPRAAQLIELTEALHPDLGGPATKATFQALAEKCRE
jgi:tetratricopeptide (TPR) repeat protein